LALNGLQHYQQIFHELRRRPNLVTNDEVSVVSPAVKANARRESGILTRSRKDLPTPTRRLSGSKRARASILLTARVLRSGGRGLSDKKSERLGAHGDCRLEAHVQAAHRAAHWAREALAVVRPMVRDFEDQLRAAGASPAMVGKIRRALSMLLADSQERGSSASSSRGNCGQGTQGRSAAKAGARRLSNSL
jgi:hypothetical protein